MVILDLEWIFSLLKIFDSSKVIFFVEQNTEYMHYLHWLKL
jgi:hypothetical protein